MTRAALIVFAIACIFVCSRLRTKRGAAIFGAAIFLILTLGVPLGELWIKCMEPKSDGCLWGRPMIWLSLGVGAALGTVMGGGAWLIALGFQRRRRLAAAASSTGTDGDAGN